jgi:hypothetical protein
MLGRADGRTGGWGAVATELNATSAGHDGVC